MTETIEVHIAHDGATHLVGRCRHIAKRGRGRATVFEYDEGWLGAAGSFAVDPVNLPLHAGPFAASALPGALRDTAPDRWGRQLIRRAFRKAGETRTLTEIDYLLAINDYSRIGALRYRREGETSFDHDIGRYRVPPLVRLPALLNAADAVHGHCETAEDLKLLLNEGSPLGGARPKSVVQDNDGNLAIAKFPKPDDTRSIPHGEVLAMQLAARAGINVASARIEDVANRPVSLIGRFDREDELRVPFVSAMTVLGLSDGDTAAYTDITDVIRMHSCRPTEDLHELWRRVVFNVLASNLDDHLRNHGFLRGPKGWFLSPAYDLNPVPIEEKARELTTWISEEGPDADIGIALNAAPYFRLEPARASAIVEHVREAVASWRALARDIGMSAADMRRYATAFAT